MKIRLTGTQDELEKYIVTLKLNYKECILECSGLYKNRGDSKLFRCYIEATEISERTRTESLDVLANKKLI